MRIMVDTNVLISALVFGGKAGSLLALLFDSDHEIYVSEYIDLEFRDKLKQKWPDKAERVYDLYHKMDIRFCESTSDIFGKLRDEKDVPVLSDALYHKIDVIVTGDKDFLEADLEKPLIYSPSMLYDYLTQKNE